METNKDSFLKYAKSMIDLVLDATGHDLVYHELCRREPRLKKTTFEVFCGWYVPSKLALGCVSWVGCCENHKIVDKEVRNLFFKEVMNLFQSPRMLENAARFSESLYASNADKESSPVVSVLVHLFHRLNLEAVARPEEGEESVHTAFCFMMEVSEALKTVFENHFDEFLFANDDFSV